MQHVESRGRLDAAGSRESSYSGRGTHLSFVWRARAACGSASGYGRVGSARTRGGDTWTVWPGKLNGGVAVLTMSQCTLVDMDTRLRAASATARACVLQSREYEGR